MPPNLCLPSLLLAGEQLFDPIAHHGFTGAGGTITQINTKRFKKLPFLHIKNKVSHPHRSSFTLPCFADLLHTNMPCLLIVLACVSALQSKFPVSLSCLFLGEDFPHNFPHNSTEDGGRWRRQQLGGPQHPERGSSPRLLLGRPAGLNTNSPLFIGRLRFFKNKFLREKLGFPYAPSTSIPSGGQKPSTDQSGGEGVKHGRPP